MWSEYATIHSQMLNEPFLGNTMEISDQIDQMKNAHMQVRLISKFQTTIELEERFKEIESEMKELIGELLIQWVEEFNATSEEKAEKRRQRYEKITCI